MATRAGGLLDCRRGHGAAAGPYTVSRGLLRRKCLSVRAANAVWPAETVV